MALNSFKNQGLVSSKPVRHPTAGRHSILSPCLLANLLVHKRGGGGCCCSICMIVSNKDILPHGVIEEMVLTGMYMYI